MTPVEPAEAATDVGAEQDVTDNSLEMLGGLLIALASAVAIVGAVTLATCFF